MQHYLVFSTAPRHTAPGRKEPKPAHREMRAVSDLLWGLQPRRHIRETILANPPPLTIAQGPPSSSLVVQLRVRAVVSHHMFRLKESGFGSARGVA